MLDHGIVIESKHCRLRPMTDADETDVIRLWNQDFVVGNLFTIKTTPEVYRKYFNIYKTDPNQWRWVIEDDLGNFVGTSGRTRVAPNVYKMGFFALYPTDRFLLVEPTVVSRRFWFDKMGAKREEFTIISTNEKIKKFHRFMKAQDTGRRSERVCSNGKKVILEHWAYTVESWNINRGFYEKFCD